MPKVSSASDHPMTVLFSLLTAAAYGLGDFGGGAFSKRGGPWAVAFMAQLGGTAALLLAACLHEGEPTANDLLWAATAGVGSGFGAAFLYRGLASGLMGVVAPISGVGAIAVPVAVGMLSGERPGLLMWVGVLLAMPAIWLVSSRGNSDGDSQGASGEPHTGLRDGIIAGLGFGVLFSALAQIQPGAGYLPLAVYQAVGGSVVVLAAAALDQAWVPRSRWAVGGLVCGVLNALAAVLFQVALRHGYLSVAAVITSLYPALTVLLAACVFRERVYRTQGAGMALCAVSVALVALG